MKKLKEILEKVNSKVSYKVRRKKYYEKNMEVIKHYEELTKYEFITEYTEKKAKYEFRRNFLIGSIVTAFLAVLSGALKTMYLLLVSFLKNSLGTGSEVEEAAGILSFLGIVIIVFLIAAFLIFIWFYYKDTREMYRDLLILEDVKKDREKE